MEYGSSVTTDREHGSKDRSGALVSGSVLARWGIIAGDIPAGQFIARFISCTGDREALDLCSRDPLVLAVRAPSRVAVWSSVACMRNVARMHCVRVGRSDSVNAESVGRVLVDHVCGGQCSKVVSLFEIVRRTEMRGGASASSHEGVNYPPRKAGTYLKARIAREWVAGCSDEALREYSCCVCARLVAGARMSWIDEGALDLSCLERRGAGVTRAERFGRDEAVSEIAGPILYSKGVRVVDGRRVYGICEHCVSVVRRGRIPRLALANGRWIGVVPHVLQNLTYVEQLMIAVLRHSFCVAQVALGQRFLSANVIVFGQPVGKMYSVLPPPKRELEQTLAILFTGPAKPTDADLRRTPFLIRHSVVFHALRWLTLNNRMYDAVEISVENLLSYSECEPPVGVIFRETNHVAAGDSSAVYETASEQGVEQGECPFIVHALSGQDVVDMSYDAKVALAIKYFETGGKVLAYGHDRHAESIYHNANLYPGMFPWLYPYGLGGFGNDKIVVRLDHASHVRANLVYADRRFQEDRCFAFIVFNQRQIRSSAEGGYLLTRRRNFAQVAEKILSVDRAALNSIAERTATGEHVVPSNDAEKGCFDLIGIVDRVAGHVEASNTSRKYMRSEIKSLIYAKGLPVFFITFAPADYKHPLCLYFCGEEVDLSVMAPNLTSSDARLRAIARNPVAAARFFDFMVNLFVKNILRYGSGEDGLFGRAKSYYGSVESQARLTLHLHLLLWIVNSLSPQEFRDRLLSDTRFESDVLDWLEDCHRGGYSRSNARELAEELEDEYTQNRFGEDVLRTRLRRGARDPATTLPYAPCVDASSCEVDQWVASMEKEADRVVFVSNRHDKRHSKGCWRGKPGYCRAWFPRELVEETIVDRASGAVKFVKTEQWINTYNPLISFLMRCNHDVTCLVNSSTQVSAAVAYISDYISKGKLTTQAFFDTVRMVFDRNTDALCDATLHREDLARSLIVKLVNAFSASAETGGPMVCAYLLGYPDHYTNHLFKPFHWYYFCREIDACFHDNLPSEDNDDERVAVGFAATGVVIVNKVLDYTCRPVEYANWCLYDFMRCIDVRKICANEVNIDEDTFQHDYPHLEQSENPSPDCSKVGRFIGAHPFKSTHGVFLRRPSKEYVLNFTGTLLPRKDKGDWETYCKTMLTLFKPGGWRTGLDIKSAEEKWSDVYTRTRFRDEHKRVMKNMQLLYECSDARDDYAAERRLLAQNDYSCSSPSNGDFLDDDELVRQQASLDVVNYDVTENSLATLLDEGCVGKKTARNRYDMDSVSDLMSREHITSSVNEGAAERMNEPQLPFKAPGDWRRLLQSAKREFVRSSGGDGKNEDFIPADRLAQTSSDGSLGASSMPEQGSVRILSVEDFQHLRKSHVDVARGPQDLNLLLIHDTLEEFSLNEEQSRAFVIVATHLQHHEPMPLHMFVAGMAGTGKSRVVLSLMSFLDRRSESSRFMVLGPTGASASLVGGSTYHSVLGYRIGDDSSTNVLTCLQKVRSRLEGVDLIFIDEVSMISCLAILFIHSQLLKAFVDALEDVDNSSVLFGGKSILFAGDPAQLPPPGQAPALYSGKVGKWSSSLSEYQQRCAFGKAIWHQFTTVVVLRRNMRQTGMSEADAAYRTCLENMRLANCTDEDVRLLRTRQCSQSEAQTAKLADRFRFVSVITARNAHRDAINLIRAREFASARGKKIQRFHSVDKWGGNPSSESARRARRLYSETVDPIRKSDRIPPELQLVLWDLPPTMTDHHAGVLELCEDMPVMLKHNEATELCATNGAEGTVHSWVASKFRGQLVLDTLFVKLVNPPRSVQLPDLPLNVIPLCRSKKTVRCVLPVEDVTVSISREQVGILPNFAMTDFASQGRTRIANVVHMKHCRNHQAMYTALSRSASLNDTLIVGPFDGKKIQCGASADLRREFREIDLLDDITRLRLENKLPSNVCGHARNSLLRTYLEWKGVNDCELSDSSLPDCLFSEISPVRKKRVRKTRDWADSRPRKRANNSVLPDKSAYDGVRSTHSSSSVINDDPTRHGLIWNPHSPSCAYDAFFTILWNIHCDHGAAWFESVGSGNGLLDIIRPFFRQASVALERLEAGRDSLRAALSVLDPLSFPVDGRIGTSVSDIARLLLTETEPFGQLQGSCNCCGAELSLADDVITCGIWRLCPDWWDTTIGFPGSLTTQEFAESFAGSDRLAGCPRCGGSSPLQVHFMRAPPILMFESHAGATILPDYTISLAIGPERATWRLTGIIYYGEEHYTIRYIDENHRLWYHDGVITRRRCVVDRDSRDQAWLLSARGRELSHLIYSRID